ncbi:MAG: hypothetical protein EOO88_12115, partial [Pedobacter sp.]
MKIKINRSLFSISVPFFLAMPAVAQQAAEKRLDTAAKANQVQELNTVQITGKKPLVSQKDGTTILHVANSSIASNSSALEILAKAPGVHLERDGTISLNGKRGITVLIDNKPTYLSSEQVRNLLSATNGASIETIELIRNPSAKYEASGSAGLINIKLKKNEAYGTNGTLTGSAGYGNYYKSNAGIGLNYRTAKLHVFGQYDFEKLKENEKLSLTRSNTNNAEQTFFRQQGTDVYAKDNNNFKSGIDYNISEQTSLGLVAIGFINQNLNTTENTTRIGRQVNSIDSSIYSQNSGSTKYKSINYNINLRSKLDTVGGEFSADIDYSRFRSDNVYVYDNTFLDVNGNIFKPRLLFKNATPSQINIWAAKADYSKQVTTGIKVESGFKSSYVTTNNTFDYLKNTGTEFIQEPLKSNYFSYREAIQAAYMELKGEKYGITVQGGLRAELTNTSGISPGAGNTVKRSYLDLFPHLSLSRELGGNELGLSYTRRIDRPDYQSLNPFSYFADLFTYSVGNPYLNPQYTNAFDLHYTIKKIGSVSLGYSRTRDVITTTLTTDTVKKTLFIKDQNLAREQTANLVFTVPLSLTPCWQTSSNFTLYKNKYEADNLMGAAYTGGRLTFIFNTTQTFQLGKLADAELAFDYQSPQVYGTYAVRPLYGIDLGISKSVLNKQLQIKANVTDLFNTRKARISSAITNQDYQLVQKQESRVFKIGLSYSFGKKTVKGTDEKA